MNNVYLGGPDVFRADALEHFRNIKTLCAKYGFNGLSPFDNEDFDGELYSKLHSKACFLGNIGLIQKSNILLLNLTPFRGACVDDGTSFEAGCGFTLGKIIYGYTEFYDEKLKDITETYFNYNYLRQESEFPSIESFADNNVNLMLQESIEISGGKILANIEDCLKDMEIIYYNKNRMKI